MVLTKDTTEPTGRREKARSESATGEKTPSTALQKSASASSGVSTTSTPISVSLATHLLELSKKVVKDEVTPETVRAACQCASEIHKLLELQWRASKPRG